MKPIKANLYGKAETEAAVGMVMLQFRPESDGQSLPFSIHVPIAEAKSFAVGKNYEISIEEVK